jgi:hypothetical protein
LLQATIIRCLLLKVRSDFPGYAARGIKLPAAGVDNLHSYLPCSPLAWSAMFDGTVYYCWSCDAHRKAVSAPDRQAACPRCGQPLTEDSRLGSRSTGTAPPAPFGYWSSEATPAASPAGLRRRVG